MKTIRCAAGLLGAAGVGLGAFGAHALRGQLEASGRLPTWETAVFYLLLHALALAALSFAPPSRLLRLTGLLWSAGAVVFSVTLFLLCLTGKTWLGAITPLGGLALLAGWLCLAWSARDLPRKVD